jgi:RimJ/RimL family protein N-acetyltransferase
MELRDGEIEVRPWREDDAPAVYEACQDEEIQYWIPVIPRPYTMDHALDMPHPDGRRRDSVMFSLLPGELR